MDDPLALDFRSDAVTVPTDEMWDAMRSAQLGWAHVGEDANVLELEAEVAALLGKEAALFVHTGGAANLVALMTHGRRGDQVVLDEASHIVWSEEWGVAYVCGLFPRLVESRDGRMDPGAVRKAIERSLLGHRPMTALVCLESSHNFAGGAALGAEYLGEVAAVAREHGVRTHLDGARLLNACAALSEDPRATAAGLDSVVINLNKGLSAPGGAVLAGTASFVADARTNLRRVGAGPGHQAGLVAAAGLVGLRTMLPQLAEDNRRARALATQLDALDGVAVDAARVETNIVLVQVAGAPAVAAELERHGLRTMPLGPSALRLVTHRHITNASVERAMSAFAAALGV